jgi:hypothetical protein
VTRGRFQSANPKKPKEKRENEDGRTQSPCCNRPPYLEEEAQPNEDGGARADQQRKGEGNS